MPCMPAFPPDPLPGDRRACPVGLRNRRWLISQLAASSPNPQPQRRLLKRSIPAPCVPGTAVPKRCRESLRGSKEKILTQEGSSSDIIKSHNKREKPLSGLAAQTLLGFWSPFLQLFCAAWSSAQIPLPQRRSAPEFQTDLLEVSMLQSLRAWPRNLTALNSTRVHRRTHRHA